ncbi:hypothetical protein HPA02_34650 [Bisbaumannia pacifica]|uniref:Uncharacterized protein n=1 Tax=Bisbaumannia pacifica TaxID=77098 RepID=A0A510XCL3_9GAMM|nr:hypothetical protein [Halomonas pacifica]GEK49182.1 hypothetical protein HPA02_34650 [Halomonas pacifica]
MSIDPGQIIALKWVAIVAVGMVAAGAIEQLLINRLNRRRRERPE